MKLSSTQIQGISITLMCIGAISLGMYTEQFLLADNGCNINPNKYLASFPIVMSLIVVGLNYKNLSNKKGDKDS